MATGAQAEPHIRFPAPEYVDHLARFGVTIARSDSLVLVTDAALCREAAEAIARDVKVSADSFSIVLRRVRANYMAESDRTLRPFQAFFVLDSTMSVLSLRDTLVSFSNARLPATETGCIGPDADFSRSVAGKIRGVLTRPRSKWYRDLLGIGGTPPDSVQHVADEVMCARSIAAIKGHLAKRFDHVQLTLFRVGRFHWAETSWPAAGEWTLVFILDRTATKVLGQY